MTTWEGVGPPSARGRAPLAIAATIPVVVLLALPWRDAHVVDVPGFTAIWLALLFACDLLTVLLLFNQYRAGGSARLIALSWAFLWGAAAAVQIALALPGVLAAEPTLGGDPNSLQWLWVSGHVVPPVLIALALAPWPPAVERRFAERRGRSVRATLSWASVAALTVLVSLSLTDLPPIVTGAGELDAFGTAAVTLLNVLAVLCAVWGVVRRRSVEGVERWAVVAAVAFLADVWLTALHEERFTVAYYLARLFGLAGAGFVMLAILRESAQLQAQTFQTAQRLEERNAELVEANRLRDHLTAVVSHDLRTPLAGLQGYLELLRDDGLDSPLARRMLERTWLLTRRLTLLSEDLLAAATLEHGDLVVSPEQVDLAQQLADCASCFPDLDLRVDCPPGLTAYADPLRLQQILSNLVRNAQKHGAEPVRIAAAADPERDGGVTIAVSDAGRGVPTAFVPRLFDRYSQAADSGTGGSGLGLSVVHDLAAAHGGSIHYDASANAFVLTLPPAYAGPEAAPAPATRRAGDG